MKTKIIIFAFLVLLISCTPVREQPPARPVPVVAPVVEQPPVQSKLAERRAQSDELSIKLSEQYDSDTDLFLSTYQSSADSLMADCAQERGDIQEVCFDKTSTLLDISSLVRNNHLTLLSSLKKDLIHYTFNSQSDLQVFYQKALKDLARDTEEGIQKLKKLNSFRKTSYEPNSYEPTSYEPNSYDGLSYERLIPNSNEPTECNFNKYDCGDFSTWSGAQAVFDHCGGVGYDVHHLDGDSDGRACETLP